MPDVDGLPDARYRQRRGARAMMSVSRAFGSLLLLLLLLG
jgi:hypothetical protein